MRSRSKREHAAPTPHAQAATATISAPSSPVPLAVALLGLGASPEVGESGPDAATTALGRLKSTSAHAPPPPRPTGGDDGGLALRRLPRRDAPAPSIVIRRVIDEAELDKALRGHSGGAGSAPAPGPGASRKPASSKAAPTAASAASSSSTGPRPGAGQPGNVAGQAPVWVRSEKNGIDEIIGKTAEGFTLRSVNGSLSAVSRADLLAKYTLLEGQFEPKDIGTGLTGVFDSENSLAFSHYSFSRVPLQDGSSASSAKKPGIAAEKAAAEKARRKKEEEAKERARAAQTGARAADSLVSTGRRDNEHHTVENATALLLAEAGATAGTLPRPGSQASASASSAASASTSGNLPGFLAHKPLLTKSHINTSLKGKHGLVEMDNVHFKAPGEPPLRSIPSEFELDNPSASQIAPGGAPTLDPGVTFEGFLDRLSEALGEMKVNPGVIGAIRGASERSLRETGFSAKDLLLDQGDRVEFAKMVVLLLTAGRSSARIPPELKNIHRGSITVTKAGFGDVKGKTMQRMLPDRSKVPLRTALASADSVEVLHEDQKSGAAAISYSGLLEDLVNYHWDQIQNLVANPLVVDKAIDEAANEEKMPETKK